MATPKQRKVTKFAYANGGKITLDEAVEIIGDQYHNARKYVGMTLARMVEAGMLTRTSPGHFELPKTQLTKINELANPSQINLF